VCIVSLIGKESKVLSRKTGTLSEDQPVLVEYSWKGTISEVNGVGEAYFRTNEGTLIGAAQAGWRIGASKERSDEVFDIIAKALLLFDIFLSLLRTDNKDQHLTPQHIAKAREYARKALAVWLILYFSVTHSKVPWI
jgi:hypothetical protein